MNHHYLNSGCDRTGLLLWCSARVLASFLHSRAGHEYLASIGICSTSPDSCCDAAPIIELGAGVRGFCSLAIKQQYHVRPTVTDGSLEVVNVLRQQAFDDVAHLSWSCAHQCGWPLHEADNIHQYRAFKLVMASDVIYPSQSLEDVNNFFRLVAWLLLPHSGRLLLCYHPRESWCDHFTQLVLHAAYTQGFRASRLAPASDLASSERRSVVMSLTFRDAALSQWPPNDSEWLQEWQQLLPCVRFRTTMKGRCGPCVDDDDVPDLWCEADL